MSHLYSSPQKSLKWVKQDYSFNSKAHYLTISHILYPSHTIHPSSSEKAMRGPQLKTSEIENENDSPLIIKFPQKLEFLENSKVPTMQSALHRYLGKSKVLKWNLQKSMLQTILQIFSSHVDGPKLGSRKPGGMLVSSSIPTAWTGFLWLFTVFQVRFIQKVNLP